MKQEPIQYFMPGCRKPFQPLLAAKQEKGTTFDEFVEKLRMPMMETPKVDGFRLLTFDLPGDRADWICMPLTRHMKPMPNRFISRAVGLHLPPHLDGEVVIINDGDPDDHCDYYSSSSQMLNHDTDPQFIYLVFDYISAGTRNWPYTKRVQHLESKLTEKLGPSTQTSKRGDPRWEFAKGCYVEVLRPTEVKSSDDLKMLLRVREQQGFEGVCLRQPNSWYKFGRASVRNQILVAVKRFEDADARVVKVHPLEHNKGDVELNAFGHATRAARKENMVKRDLVGSFECRDTKTNVEVNVGSGLSGVQREELWLKRDVIVKEGWILKYRHQPHGRKEDGRPRIATFLGFREQE